MITLGFHFFMMKYNDYSFKNFKKLLKVIEKNYLKSIIFKSCRKCKDFFEIIVFLVRVFKNIYFFYLQKNKCPYDA